MEPQENSFLGISEMENMKLPLPWRNRRIWRRFQSTVRARRSNNREVRSSERRRWGPMESTSGRLGCGGPWRRREKRRKINKPFERCLHQILTHKDAKNQYTWKWCLDETMTSGFWINDFLCYGHVLIKRQKNNHNQGSPNGTYCLLNVEPGFLLFDNISYHRS